MAMAHASRWCSPTNPAAVSQSESDPRGGATVEPDADDRADDPDMVPTGAELEELPTPILLADRMDSRAFFPAALASIPPEVKDPMPAPDLPMPARLVPMTFWYARLVSPAGMLPPTRLVARYGDAGAPSVAVVAVASAAPGTAPVDAPTLSLSPWKNGSAHPRYALDMTPASPMTTGLPPSVCVVAI